jgi:D-alanyl-D-alanine carboxypeptidase
MQLAEEGKLGLEDPLSRWLPDYPNITNTITIRQLLNHTSGIYNFTENPALWPAIMANTNYTHMDCFRFVKPSYFPPGKGYHYSTTGFTLLGLVAEAAGRDSVERQIRSRFLEPLHLTGTYFKGAEPATGESAHGFTTQYTGKLQDVTTNTLWQAEYNLAWTGGALTSTAYDTALWTHALYGGSVLSKSSLADMTKWTPESGSGHGLGTFRYSTSRGDFWGHSGGIAGYGSLAGYSPTLDCTVVMLMNEYTRDTSDAALWNIWLALIEAL